MEFALFDAHGKEGVVGRGGGRPEETTQRDLNATRGKRKDRNWMLHICLFIHLFNDSSLIQEAVN